MSKMLKKLTTKTVIVILALIVLGVPLLYLTVLNQKEAKASWFDDNWLYRKAIAITNAGILQTDFQVSFTIDTTDTTKFKSDCSDIRVTDISGKILPYWIEENNPGCGNALTKIWTKIPSAFLTGSTIYVYYGNPSATSLSDGNKVFEFFDSFATVDQSKWTTTGSPTISSNALTLSNSAGVVSKSTKTTNDGTKQLVFRAKTAATTASAARLGYSNTSTLATGFTNDDSAHILIGNEQAYLSPVASTNELGLWRFADLAGDLTNGTDTTDSSGQSNPLTSVNGATRVTGVLDYGVTFNGSTQYLKQKIYTDQTGATFGPTVHGLNLANGAGFYRTQGKDFTSYAGTDGSTTPYMLVLKDSASKTAWGYIGSTDATEAVGSELVTNPGFETYTGTQDDGVTDSFGVGFGLIAGAGGYVDSTATVHSGSGAVKLYRGTGTSSIYTSSLTSTPGALYKLTFWTRGDGTNAGRYNVLDDTHTVTFIPNTSTGVTGTAYTQVTAYFTAPSGDTSIIVNFLTAAVDSSYAYFDDISVKQVTDVGTDGVHILSTKNGATRNWAGIKSGFNYNDTSYTFEVRKTDFQITGALTVGAWVKRSSTGTFDYIINKAVYNTYPDYKGFSLRLGSNDTISFGVDAALGLTSPDTYTSTTDWYYVVATYDPSITTARLYVNGAQVNSSATFPSSFTDSYQSLCVGNACGTSGNYFAGSIDSPFVLNQALAADQVLALYNMGAPSANKFGLTTTNGGGTNSTFADATSTATMDTNYHVFKITQKASTTDFDVDGTVATSSTNSPDSAQYIRLENTDASNAVSVDWVFLRKSATTEPSASISGAEEKSPGPVGYWKFDEGQGTVANDSTSNKNNGTITGATWVLEDQCIAGKCLKFDGSSSYVDITGNIAGHTNYTMEAWIKPTILSGYKTIIQADDGAIQLNGDKVYYYSVNTRDGTGAIKTKTTGSLKANKWSHITVVATGTSGLALYINGILISSSFSADSPSNNYSDDLIGVMKNDSGVFDRYFNGFIDEPKIYPYARTSAQIKADYNSRGASKGLSVQIGPQNQWLSQGLVGYWKMDETSGNASDSSGNGNTGTLGVGTSAPSYAGGKFGNGLQFDGGDDYVDLGSGSTLNLTDEITVSAWINPANVTGIKAIYSKWDWGEPIMLKVSANALYGSIGTGWHPGEYTEITTAAGTISQNSWQHVTLVAKANKLIKLYINGQLSKEQTTGVAGIRTSATNVIGKEPAHTTTFFNGNIDEVRIYNRTLTPKEVSDLYNFAPGPVGYWNFEEGSGTAVNDRSGYGNNGSWAGSGTSRYTPGKYGKAGKFNGTDDYVAFSSYTISADNGSFGFWFKTSADMSGCYSGRCALISNDTEIIYKILGLIGNGSAPYSIEGETNTNGEYFVQVSNIIPVNTWNYIFVSFDNKSAKTYLNGKLIDTKTIANNVTLNNIGGRINGGYTVAYNGLIDDVKIYNYARTPSQILADYGTGQAQKQPIAYYKFDEGQETVANNVGNGGAGLNGVLTSMSSPATSTSGWTSSGKFAKALIFDGQNDYIAITNNASINNMANATIDLWIKLNSLSAATIPISKDGDSGYYIQINTNGRLYLRYGTAGGNVGAAGDITTGTWIHLVMIFNNGTLTAYKNGVLLSGSVSGSAPTGMNDNLWVGAYSPDGGASPTGYWVNGSIDEVKIYPYALTADEVKTDYNRGLSLMLGSSGDNASYAKGAQNQEYCIPGDTTSCVAPVARWDFEEMKGGTVNDKSGNNNTGTWSGTGPHWAPGNKVGGAGKFNGSDDKVDAGSSTTLQPANATWELWVNMAKLSSTDNLGREQDFWSMQTSVSGWSFLNSNNATDLRFTIYINGGWRNLTFTSSTQKNQWYHLAATYDGSSLKGYINGIPITPVSVSGSIDYTSVPSLKFGVYGNGSNYYSFTTIDQARIFNYARSAAQIAWDYNRGAPVGWWKFDECQGATAHDASGNNNSGTITVATGNALGTCTTASTFWGGSTGTGAGKRNYAPTFDGTDDYVQIPDNNSLNVTPNVSVMAWIKRATTGHRREIYNKIQDSGGFEFWIASNDKLYFSIVTNLGVGDNDGGVGTISDTSWHHAVKTYDGSNVKTYIDGKLVGSVSKSSWTIGTNSSPARIGEHSVDIYLGNNPFTGQIDDVKIFNYALTASQVKTLFNNGAVSFGPSSGTP